MRPIAAGLGVLAGCVVTLAVAGQSGPPTPQATFRAGIDVVRLDVSVLDRNRRPVRGLTADDFTVLENGKPQPIAAFAAIDIPDVVEPPSPWMRSVASDVATNQLDTRRVVVIVMDDGSTETDPGVAKIAKQIARGVIERLGPNDLAAVVFTFMGRPQNFTNDRRQLIAAADTFIPKYTLAPHPMSAAALPIGRGRGTTAALTGPPLGCRNMGQFGCMTDTLKRVAAALEDTPAGRKTIVLISSARIAPADFTDEKLDEMDELGDLGRTFASLQRANANIYAFDPAGLTPDGIMAHRLDKLRALAENTGGRAVLATNAPWDHVAPVFQENSSYYLLGIRSTNTAQDGRFRRISVKVNRPDAEVRTRPGYFAARATKAAPSKQPTAPVTALDKAFRASMPTGDLPLELSVAPFAGSDRRRTTLAVVVATRRPVGDQVAKETLEVRTTAFDVDFKERGAARQTAEVTLRPHPTGERRVEVHSRLTLPPGRYEIRVGAEAPGAAGGVFVAVDVPDFSKPGLWLSGLVLGHGANAAELLADLTPITPTTIRQFGVSDAIAAFLRVYQGGKDPLVPVRLSARIVDSSTRALVEDATTLGAEQFGTGRSADYRLNLPLARLADGDYLLTIEVAGRGKSVSRDVRFRVAPTLANTGGLDDAMHAGLGRIGTRW